MTRFINNPKAFSDDVTSHLARCSPFFLSRVGGSDTAAVVDYLRARQLGPAELELHVAKHLPIVSRYNGFYDLQDPTASYFKYIKCLIDAYVGTSVCTLCNFQLLSIFFRETLHPQFYAETFDNKETYIRLIGDMQRATPTATFYPYQFIEQMTLGTDTLFRVFSKALVGRTVMVISPFSESIIRNFPKRHEFFRTSYDYPEFNLELVNCPITYAGLPANLYPHSNWFETLAALKSEIAAKSFDIALLSCGSYAIPLGEFIKNTLGKKAIYIGGVLQLFFGIMGRRYENPFFTDQINLSKFIYPLERERYLKDVQFPPELAREAFGAYF